MLTYSVGNPKVPIDFSVLAGILTLKGPSNIIADDNFFFFYFYLSKKKRLDVSCESSIYHMNYQALFSLEKQ